MSVTIGGGKDQMQLIMLPPRTEVASEYVAMEREWNSEVRPVSTSHDCPILTMICNNFPYIAEF